MNLIQYHKISNSLPSHVKMVVVSKMQPVERIQALYDAGHRVFGENRPQELKTKYEVLPQDIDWHFIGHLQTNKIKYIAPFVSVIHSVDSFGLLQEINRYAVKHNRTIPCLIQFFIAKETSKYGFSWEECENMLTNPVFSTCHNVSIVGVMGMATFTDDKEIIREEFRELYTYFKQLKTQYFSNQHIFKEISMGMSEDYPVAIEEGATLVRIGSAIFSSFGT